MRGLDSWGNTGSGTGESIPKKSQRGRRFFGVGGAAGEIWSLVLPPRQNPHCLADGFKLLLWRRIMHLRRGNRRTKNLPELLQAACKILVSRAFLELLHLIDDLCMG